MLEAARKESRRKFEANKDVRDPQEIQKLRNDAWEAASFVRDCVAQAVLNERGNYELHVRPHHVDGVAESAIQEDGSDPGSERKRDA